MAKSNRKQALGRGLSALLNDSDNAIESIHDKNADQVIGSIIDLDLEKITNWMYLNFKINLPRIH